MPAKLFQWPQQFERQRMPQWPEDVVCNKTAQWLMQEIHSIRDSPNLSSCPTCERSLQSCKGKPAMSTLKDQYK